MSAHKHALENPMFRAAQLRAQFASKEAAPIQVHKVNNKSTPVFGRPPLGKGVSSVSTASSEQRARENSDSSQLSMQSNAPIQTANELRLEFWQACRSGDVSWYQRKARRGGVDLWKVCSSYGFNGLHMACVHGHVDLIAAMLQDIPETIDWMTNRGESPLHCAAEQGHTAACELLLNSRRPDLLVKFNQHLKMAEQSMGLLPEELALKRGHTHTAAFLRVRRRKFIKEHN